MALEFEDSEIKGLALRCDGRCAYCCLCPPGLLEVETEAIVNACHEKAGYIGQDRLGDSARAISTQGDWGACVFLENKACMIYESRPHFCRQYPLQVYSGWRLQASAIRSCRGLVRTNRAGPVALKSILKKEVDTLGEDYYNEVLEDTSTSFRDLEGQGKVFDTYRTVRARALAAANTVGDAGALLDILGIKGVKAKYAGARLLDEVWPDIEGTFHTEDVMNLPVYPAMDHSWRVFRYDPEEGSFGEYLLKASGTLVFDRSVSRDRLGLFPLPKRTKMVLHEYLYMAFMRDIFYGMVAREALIEERRMGEVASEMGVKIATDLWWRAGLLSVFFRGRKKGKDKGLALGTQAARDAVIFMDADLLDSYALGAII
jgi:Fe-S-cluster containining protein